MVSIMKALPADRPLHRRYLHVATTSDPVGWGAREVASNETKGTPPPAAEVKIQKFSPKRGVRTCTKFAVRAAKDDRKKALRSGLQREQRKRQRRK